MRNNLYVASKCLAPFEADPWRMVTYLSWYPDLVWPLIPFVSLVKPGLKEHKRLNLPWAYIDFPMDFDPSRPKRVEH
jgi:hypothetical protein